MTDKTYKLLRELVNRHGTTIIAAKLNRYKGFGGYLSPIDLAQWILGERTPEPEQVKVLTVALPKIKAQLKGKRRPRLAAPEMG